MGCKWHIRGLSVLRVAAASTLLGVALGLTLPAAQSRAARTPAVAPLGRLTEADLIAVAPGSISAKTLTAIGHLPGVAATQSVEAGALTVKNTSAVVLGVNPSTFRGYTPKATAASNQLWQ